MNAEKYVNNIVNRIKCSGAKKKEIRIQLSSDISARMEQGESLEQIIESMGTAQEIAAAFCQDLSEAEKKAYRRHRAGMITGAVAAGVLVLVFLIWWAFPKPVSAEDYKQFARESVNAEVETVVTLLDENDFAALQGMAVRELQGVLTQETIDKARALVSDEWGEMQGIGTVYSQAYKQRGTVFVVTQTDVVYENVRAVYTITFDEDMKMAGIYIR